MPTKSPIRKDTVVNQRPQHNLVSWKPAARRTRLQHEQCAYEFFRSPASLMNFVSNSGMNGWKGCCHPLTLRGHCGIECGASIAGRWQRAVTVFMVICDVQTKVMRARLWDSWESRVKKIELCAVLGYNNRSYLGALTPFYTFYQFYGATYYFSKNPQAYKYSHINCKILPI